MLDTPKPVAANDRFYTLDLLRGFALLGILGPNMLTFAWPSAAMTSHLPMGDTPANELGHAAVDVFFLGKMMFNFAMLFGAGIVLFDRKFTPDDGAPRPGGTGLWYARCAWLLGLGMLHAAGLWYGDILVLYAVTGMLLVWWLRRLSAGALFAIGGTLYVLGAGLFFGFTLLGVWAVNAGQAEPSEIVGNVEQELEAYRGGYLDAFGSRIVMLLFWWLVMIPVFVPAITGIMTLGMALMKSGFLTGERGTRLYAIVALVGLTVGLGGTLATMNAFDAWFGELSGFAFQGIAQFVGVPTALGYAALVILVAKKRWLAPVTGALANVGRMALSNYFAQTLICTTLFYGYGLGYFGRIGYPGLFYVMGGVWAFNIVFSAVWLRFFRFGPAEWVWRSLTYLKPQPLLR
ncbi:MAG: DUF418 domain-containing protein [Planctomycetota bacterium]